MEQIVRDLIEVQPQGHELGVFGGIFWLGHQADAGTVRVVLRVIDPEASRPATRQIVRQEYNIVNPMELWHMDGWHKLINHTSSFTAASTGYAPPCIHADNVPIERTWGHLRKRYLQFYCTIFKAMIDGLAASRPCRRRALRRAGRPGRRWRAVEEEEEEEHAIAHHGQPNIVVPPPDCPLNAEQLQQLQYHQSPYPTPSCKG